MKISIPRNALVASMIAAAYILLSVSIGPLPASFRATESSPISGNGFAIAAASPGAFGDSPSTFVVAQQPRVEGRRTAASTPRSPSSVFDAGAAMDTVSSQLGTSGNAAKTLVSH